MRAGELRQRVTLQQPDMLRDSYAAEIPVWVNLATVWAKIVTTGGSETIDSGQAAAALLTHEITIRWRSDVTPTTRVVWGSRVFEILAVVDDNVRRMLVLTCTEVVGIDVTSLGDILALDDDLLAL